jgi:hypothetical protein
MSVDTNNPKRAAKKEKQQRRLNRSDLATPFFIFAGFGAVYLFGMSIFAAVYVPMGRSHGPAGHVSWPALLFLPCFLIALLRNRWASIPMWLCCAALLVIGFMPSHQPAEAGVVFQPGIGMVFIPALTELARFLRRSPAGKSS